MPRIFRDKKLSSSTKKVRHIIILGSYRESPEYTPHNDDLHVVRIFGKVLLLQAVRNRKNFRDFCFLNYTYSRGIGIFFFYRHFFFFGIIRSILDCLQYLTVITSKIVKIINTMTMVEYTGTCILFNVWPRSRLRFFQKNYYCS